MIFIRSVFWKTCLVILIFRCRCTENVYRHVDPPRVIRVTLRQPLCIAFFLGFVDLMSLSRTLCLPVFLGGGGGSATFSKLDTSVCSTLGTRTLSLVRQFIEDAEKDSEKEADTGASELNVKDTRYACRGEASCQEDPRTLDKEAIKALRMLFEDFEDQLQRQNDVSDESASEEEDETPPQRMAVHSATLFPYDEEGDEFLPRREPQLYLCDDWIQPMAVMSRPKELTARDKMRANVAKNCLLVTLMSLELGYGSILERYQQERDSILERYQQERNMSSPVLSSVLLTDEELFVRVNEPPEVDSQSQAAPAAMPPPTRLSGSIPGSLVHNVGTEGVKDSNLKVYYVMSVKQTLREDLAEHAYQFSCRAADWSRSDLRSVPMQFEPLELHVVDALGQQEVPDYFQQPAKATTEDVSVMRGPYALEWICAVREEIESFKRLGVYEEVPKGSATSTPLPARLILVTKPMSMVGLQGRRPGLSSVEIFKKCIQMNSQPPKLQATHH